MQDRLQHTAHPGATGSSEGLFSFHKHVLMEGAAAEVLLSERFSHREAVKGDA